MILSLLLAQTMAEVFEPGSVSDRETPQWEFALTPGGDWLFYATEDAEGRRIVVEQRKSGGVWGPARPIPATAAGADGGASLSADGETLFFGSSRGGADGRDLHALDVTSAAAAPIRITDTPGIGEIRLSIDRDGDGYLWTADRYDGSPAIGFYRIRYADSSLDVVDDASDLHENDVSGENGPFVDPAGGGEDLFVSPLRDGTAGAPVPLGPSVSTRFDEISAQVTDDGKTLLFSTNRPYAGGAEGSQGDLQIWQVPVGEVAPLAAVIDAASPLQPVLLAPDALHQEGRITLTPSFTEDGERMYFAQSECEPIWKCPQSLKTSVKRDGAWTTPTVVPLPRGYSDSLPRVDYPEVSPDGTSLLMSWSGQLQPDQALAQWENFDLYRLDLTIEGAVPAKLTGPDLNRVRKGRVGTLRFVNNETAPSLTADGTLHFWSERLDGAGERDVYRAEPDSDGGYRAPRLLPAPINSAGRDDGAWIHPSGRLMLLTYGDRGGEGGADIFVATEKDGVWSDPVNLGHAVNSPAADFAAKLTPDAQSIVFSSLRGTDGSEAAAAKVWIARVADIDVLAAALSSIAHAE